MQRITQAVKDLGCSVNWYSRIYDNSLDVNCENNIIQTKFKRGPLFYLEFNYILYKKLIKSKASIISAVDLDTLAACAFASKKINAKLVFDAHEIFYEVPELSNKPLKKWLWKQVARWNISKAHSHYTVNNSLKNHHETKYSQPFHVIRNVPQESLDLKVVNNFEKKQLVYLGVLNKGRGIETAIKAIKQLPTYQLLLIGEGDITHELKKLAKSEGVEGRVNFAGYKHPEEIFPLLLESSVGINILEAYSENYRLSLANKFFDYMHAGLPSINMAYPEYEDINGKHEVSILINKPTVAQFIRAIEKLEDQNQYDKLHENCLKYKSLYSWQNESQKLKSIYQALFV